MLTLKFGGTSMGSAKNMLNSANIIMQQAKTDRVSVVVSAVGGVSNTLQESIDACMGGQDSSFYVQEIRKIHTTICEELGKENQAFDSNAAIAKLKPIFDEYDRLLSAVSVFKECPLSVHCRIMGMGELLSSPIMACLLESLNQKICLIDSREVIFTTGDQSEGDPDYEKTIAAFAPYLEGEIAPRARILLLPGFVCQYENGKPGLLGRNGSDFSAAIVAVSLKASKVEFWTDVDGIFTADPRIVEDAILVNDMSYEEAMELSFFGSKVLYPKTLAPLSARGIEAWSLNSHNPSARGTRIGVGPFTSRGAVRGISCLKETALINIAGSGLKDKSGMASRIFAAVSRAGISMLLITQSSSEYSISFCVRQNQASKVRKVLEEEFKYEMRAGDINTVDVIDDCAIVSIVGDSMKKQRGIASTFLDSLASQDINILALAQGSSERSISVVIHGSMGDTAVRISHRFFFNTKQTIQVFCFGTGTIGGCFLDQVRDQQKELLNQNIELKVMCISGKTTMLLDKDSIDLSSWRERKNESKTVASVDAVLDLVSKTKPLNPVFVDCTASNDLPSRYLDIFNAGMSIVTPNKRANSMSMDFYRNIRKTANKMHKLFFYETNVGAGLPVMDTLQNMFKSGDHLVEFSGIMSGSLSYIFGLLDEGESFSGAVLKAREKGFTEPDPRDDLSGMDVARKVLIIAREAGMNIELDDVKMNKLFPDDFDDSGSTDIFLKNLPKLDEYFDTKVKSLAKEGKVLRMAAKIKDGVCSVGLLEVDSQNPLYVIKGGENAFVFHTARYNPIPMTIRGYGAGAAVTAAGVFGDVLRTVSWNRE
ncbi:MAG: bifunctional aspartate kinase/homoserine dehydrogenase I [Treponema sp. CETP13]|nr:MAG: bifunctional aspartate kinase/homoserine dehydrogenase I [Treponema sp. CETP13]